MVSTLEHGHLCVRLEATQNREQKAKLQVKTHRQTSGGKNVERKYCAAEALLQFLSLRTVYQEFTVLLLTEVLDYSPQLAAFEIC